MIFYKTVSAGNDFLHVNVDDYNAAYGNTRGFSKGELAVEMCRRQYGAGADGVVFYTLNNEWTGFEIFNRDGTEAELSGNGMAGLSALLNYLEKSGDTIKLQTRTGPKTHQILEKNSNRFKLKIEIGVPDFQNRTFFPFLEAGTNGYSHNGTAFYPVSVGNPHVVVLFDEAPEDDALELLGKNLESADIFPQKTNVEFVSGITDNRCRVYYYERGVGKTLSSSTGSAAVFAVLQKLGRINTSLVIDASGEQIKICGNRSVYIENSTKIVYKCIWLN